MSGELTVRESTLTCAEDVETAKKLTVFGVVSSTVMYMCGMFFPHAFLLGNAPLLMYLVSVDPIEAGLILAGLVSILGLLGFSGWGVLLVALSVYLATYNILSILATVTTPKERHLLLPTT